MPKNIVICCDGTGNEFGDSNSNVVKLCRALVMDDARQVVYYHPGLGTMGAPNALLRITKWWTRMLGLAFGYGLTADIAGAYAFLMNEYEPGDQLYVFGFSRGAYTARALLSMLHMYGLLHRGNDGLVAYVARMLRYGGADRFALAAQFRRTFSRLCKPCFVGLWDTVGSVGWIYNPVKLPYTANNPDVAVARHAVSIDELRAFYRMNLLHLPAPSPDPAVPAQDIQQVWFAGAHSDVGGGYPEAESQLAKIALRWMLGEAGGKGLLIDPGSMARVLGEAGGGWVRPDPAGPLHVSLRGAWWILEIWPRRTSEPVLDPDGAPVLDADGKPKWVKKWTLPLGRRRKIPPGSVIHASVGERMKAVPSYRPPNLPASYSVAP